MKNVFKNQLSAIMLALTGFNFALSAFRMLATSSLSFGFLAWNLVLATVPLLISFYLTQRRASKTTVTALSAAWLLFLPNAPYILTDFLHFRKASLTMPAWYDLLLLASYAITGLLFGLLSMRHMHFVWRRAFGNIADALIPASAILSGFGIYLGRFERYNSWDVIADPVRILSDSLYLMTELRTIGFTFGYGTLLLLLYYFMTYNPKFTSAR